MKKVRNRSGKAGLPPGSLIQVGSDPTRSTRMLVIRYGVGTVVEHLIPSTEEIPVDEGDSYITWLDVQGLDDDLLLRDLSARFDLHDLILEDILNTDHRPKMEEHQNMVFVVAKTISVAPDTGVITTTNVCFILRERLLVSFHADECLVLESIRERLRKDLGRVRRAGSDYLLYALLDVIVDQYFLVLDDLAARIEQLENRVTLRPLREDLRTIQRLKVNLIMVGRQVLPMRELAGRLNALQDPLIERTTKRYLSDLQDHTVYIAESIGTYREMLQNLEATYHAGVNMRMGQVMRLLTVISTIFIPLTFIVGIYGMNFRYMPELEWRSGYFIVLALMAGIAVLMLMWFRKKKLL